MAGLGELARNGSPSAATALGSFQPGVLNSAMSAAIKCGALKVGLSTFGAVNGVFPVGQALAVLARGAWALSGNRELNRNFLDGIKGQRLMAAGDFDPSAAIREINGALQTTRRSCSTLNWDEIPRALCGLYTTDPVRSAYIDGELDLAKAITDKNMTALRNPCDMHTMAHADAIHHELSGFGTSIHLRNTQRALALESFSERPAAAGQGEPRGGGPPTSPSCPARVRRPLVISSASSTR